MSITIQSSGAASPASRTTEASKVSRRHEDVPEGNASARSGESRGPAGRNALMEALSIALTGLTSASQTDPSSTTPAAGEQASGSRIVRDEQKHALHAFVHELFAALRPSGGEDGVKGHHGRGFAWGRASASELSQRLEALAKSLGEAASAGGSIAPPVPDPAADPVAQAALAAGDAVTAVPTAAPPAVPPDGAIAAASGGDRTVAGSPLLAAFERLAAALGGGAVEVEGAASPAGLLVALLEQMAQTLNAGSAGGTLASGVLVDVSA